jgi:hypothetical protein
MRNEETPILGTHVLTIVDGNSEEVVRTFSRLSGEYRGRGRTGREARGLS